ncbi:MAG: tetratricopeptide repeat protein, partial [SAR324 cluster bacterium]|nr:tetratricopeptide repeat protein [SAR324 cluster bacterium]
WRPALIAASVLVLVAAGSFGTWLALRAPPEDPILAMPTGPRIAVMPFANMSGDPEQEYFSDGLAEDVITALSHWHSIPVIARTSSFTYKGQSVRVQRIAEELGARYVLEGSVRRAGNRVRITAQLIEATTGNHVWAESYDCEMRSIFDVQDDITAQIVGSVNPELYSAEVKHARQKSTENLEAWSYAVRGRWHVTRLTKDDAVEAKRYLTKALELNPNHVAVLAFMAYSHITDVFFGLSASPPESIKQAMELSQQAISLDENDPWAQCARGMAMFVGKDQDKAIAHYRRAIELNPNFAIAYGYLSLVLAHAGEPLPAIEAGEKAIHLSPRDPELVHFYVGIGTAHFIAGDYAEAVNWADKVIQVRPTVPSGYRLRAASLAYLGEIERASESLHEMLGLVPHATASLLRNAIHFKNTEDSDRYIEGLRKAGLPE